MTSDLHERLARPRFPRSAGYDPQWTIDNLMGPNPLWLVEWLTEVVDLPAGARVLDLGCGKAMTSIFLAREFQAQVVAADLWVAPHENWARVREAGCAASVLPIWAEAHDLKFAAGYFDAIVSVDAYHYFGTDESYLPYLVNFLRPGGTIAIAVPSIAAEFTGNQLPDYLQPHWPAEWWTFHSPLWWRQMWERNGVVDVQQADLLEDGWRYWADWLDVCIDVTDDRHAVDDAKLVRADAGRNLGFARVVARRR